MIRPVMTSFFAMVLCLALGCGKDDDGEAKQPPAKVQPSAPAPAAEPPPVEAEDPPPPALTAKPLSELDSFAWMDILKDAGWTDASSGGMAMGAWSQTTITAKKDGVQAKVTIVAPTGEKEDPGASVKAQSPKDQLEALQAQGAAELLRDDFLVAVTIEGDAEGAAQLLAHIKNWVIVE